ncbi:tyrosine-protein phosphatase non-receptor type 61F-like isoform X1 [Sitodiplosis mosellana]|uniref:tyrosine-protein phosphatase non-receptor type 61F-like isoform X1 n=1 Tax=Sitodiplosis mosellana TaxID=263140 RepID=UPI002443CE71|nr:tyrosine-protein phosphatase non-receptor type 61F-like isoform X1 [Sitodiplosis mosellana]
MSDEQDVDLDDDDNDDDDGVDDDEQATTEQTTKLLNGTSSNGSNECEDSFNPDATLPPSPTKMSTTSLTEFNNSNSSLETPSSPENDSGLTSTAELRRRKRKERNADIEAKIKDIKRKQKETEAAAEAAPKKRRCHMIFSGVVVCVICCANVYSKFGQTKIIFPLSPFKKKKNQFE